MAERKIYTGLPAQIGKFKKDIAQFEGLLFSDVISEQRIKEIMEREIPEYRDRIFPPVKTVPAMIAQALDNDRSYAKAVKRHAADLAEQGEPICYYVGTH